MNITEIIHQANTDSPESADQAKGVTSTALLNDVTILLFVTDLAFLLSPWT